METFPQHWAHSELFTMLMGWALDLLSFVVCSVLGFSCYSEAKVAWLTMLCQDALFLVLIFCCCPGDQDADGGGGAVHAGLAAAAAVRCPQPNIPGN